MWWGKIGWGVIIIIIIIIIIEMIALISWRSKQSERMMWEFWSKEGSNSGGRWISAGEVEVKNQKKGGEGDEGDTRIENEEEMWMHRIR